MTLIATATVPAAYLLCSQEIGTPNQLAVANHGKCAAILFRLLLLLINVIGIITYVSCTSTRKLQYSEL
jgi:hypothetical protein